MIRHKLIDTQDEVFNIRGIFSMINDKNAFEWMTQDDAFTLDTDYYLNHSGNKFLSPMYETLLEQEKEGKIQSSLSSIADIIILRYKDKWNRLFNLVFNTNYNPINNYDMEQVETPDIQHTVNEKYNTDIVTEGEQDANVYGFNSSDSVPSADGNSKQHTTGDKNDNTKDVIDKETGTRRLTRSGNIGVTSSQQLMESEIKLREWNFFANIMNDIDAVMCCHIYG